MAVIGPIRRTPWGRPLPVSAGVSSAPARTYAEFQTQMAALATNGVRSWSATLTPVGKYYTTAAAYTGSMVGSTWGPSAAEGANEGATLARMIQHGFADSTIATDQVTNTARVYFELAASPATNSSAFPAVSRNGFTSTASGSTGVPVRQMVDLIRWDFTLNKAYRSNPFAGTAETEYTW